MHNSCGASGSAEIDGVPPAAMATLTNLAISDKFGGFEDRDNPENPKFDSCGC